MSPVASLVNLVVDEERRRLLKDLSFSLPDISLPEQLTVLAGEELRIRPVLVDETGPDLGGGVHLPAAGPVVGVGLFWPRLRRLE